MSNDRTVFHWGTRREMYAIMILQTFIADQSRKNESYSMLIDGAISLADQFHYKLEETAKKSAPEIK